MRFRLLAAALIALTACTGPQEPDYAADFPLVGVETATRIIGMSCQELALTRVGLDLLERFGPLVHAALETTDLSDEDKALILSLVDEAETTRDQVRGLVGVMRTVRFCG
ncbi:hypothetical protein FHS89_002148 [Rubricella aquisinus]|uniref:Uncharacterized protein n=1 Tax=Rubricella aquisinus TaxID=2028108 RepID=A0A840WR21_9RHOB|nr:hypothetical protein [Rubricella aquisinus]MBB5516122.1 hypothetical protein [Rubricella aquisinus]